MNRKNEFEMAVQPEPVYDSKIRQILEVLLLIDPSIEDGEVLWEFNGKQRTIKKFEEFPYYLYKAIWDEDFKAIQWAEYENDETMLINYDMLEKLLEEYFDEHHSEDFEIDHNRLRHNLVEIFGFNEIPKDNIRRNKFDNDHLEFFSRLEEYGGSNVYHWVEYHHPDFLKKDSSLPDNPKSKNSKFFKLCQTLKMPYRLRKQTGERSRKRRNRNQYRHVEDEFYPPPPPPGCVPIAFPGQLPPYQLPARSFNVDQLRNIPDIHAPESLVIDDNLDQQSIDRAFAESVDTNSVTRESEMLSIDSKSNL